MTPTDLEEYRETIEAIGWDFDAFRKVCQYSTFVGPTPAQVSVFDFLELAHSRGERIKELEERIRRIDPTGAPDENVIAPESGWIHGGQK